MINPVFRKETKTALRNWKIFYAIAGYVLLVTLTAVISIWQIMYNSYYASFDPSQMATIYIGLTILELVLVLLITPAMTGGSISGERERQTLDLLMVTKMSPFSIIFGKFLSGLSLVVLMIFATMPIFALLMYFGGTTIVYVIAVTIYMILVCGAFGALAIYLSTVFKKTVTSMVFTYIWTGILCGGTMILYVLSCAIYGNYFNMALPLIPRVIMLAINPAVGLISIICEQTGSSFMNNILDLNNYFGQTYTPMTVPIPLWIINAAVLIVFILIFLLLASHRLKKISKKG